MKLVVGLGNPGRKYQGTRHNVGFEVLAELARRFAGGRPKSAFQGEAVDVTLDGQRAWLFCPHTFMNRSGSAIVQARDFYKLTNDELLVVCDDLNLPVAKLRFRARGSSGGQKGLDDTIRALGTEEFARLRVGIGPLPAGWDAADFVLGKFTKEERSELDHAVVLAADAVVAWAAHGIEHCMNTYN
jgi:peptidyl-tRNA hydrolase, PTH1 family